MTGEPPVRRRLVGGALRRYRENMGYTLDDVARVLECDRSKVSRIETGQRGIRPKELRELLAEYGVPAREQAALTAIASRGGQHGWWQPYRDILPGPYLDYVIMEAAAAEIMTYEAQLVPELLQTEDYARALAAGSGYDSGPQREEILTAKGMRREAILGRRKHRLWVVLSEAALRQAFKIKSPSPRLWNTEGLLKEKKGDLAGAIDAFKHINSIDDRKMAVRFRYRS